MPNNNFRLKQCFWMTACHPGWTSKKELKQSYKSIGALNLPFFSFIFIFSPWLQLAMVLGAPGRD